MIKKPTTFLDQIVDNWIYKIIALVVAGSVWATTLHGRKDTLLVRTMDLEFQLSERMTVSSVQNKNVNVKVSGSRVALKKFNLSSNSVAFNLIGRPAGPYKLHITAADIPLPSGVKFISVEPQDIELEVKEVQKP